MDRHQLEIHRLLKRLGLTPGATRQKGGHIKMDVSNGVQFHKIVFPVSPSDERWRKNMESFLRKKFNL